LAAVELLFVGGLLNKSNLSSR